MAVLDGGWGRGQGSPSLVHALPLPSGCPQLAPENNLQLSEEPRPGSPPGASCLGKMIPRSRKANPTLPALIPTREVPGPEAGPPRGPAPCSRFPGPAMATGFAPQQGPCGDLTPWESSRTRDQCPQSRRLRLSRLGPLQPQMGKLRPREGERVTQPRGELTAHWRPQPPPADTRAFLACL